MTISFQDIGKHLGTRAEGATIRQRVETVWTNSKKIVFDFSNVETVSNSFADECFAKLVLDFELDEIKNKTTFENATPFIKAVIANAFKERLSQLVVA